MNAGTSAHDATVDLAMFASEDENDDSADYKRVSLPKACWLYSGWLEDGQMATAAETCGDGACSLHCLWGSLISTPSGNIYYCEDARRKLCEAMPLDVSDMSNSPCGAAVRVLLDNMWSDTIGYVMRMARAEPLMPGYPLLCPA